MDVAASPRHARPEQQRAFATAHNFHPAYRPDIDGLRAVAVLSVVGYHIFPEWIHGGFVGVDVFFVISGFLISTIIFRSLASDSFSFSEFYGHRIRRIFPALIVVIAFCILLGWHVLLPSEFKYLGKHVAASAGFVQNFVLARESGYFNIASELKPLNHLWSLAVEEQYYAIFPLLMWIAWRLRLNLPVLVTAIFGLSFAANVIGVHNNEIATFFSLQTRAWELMAGALLATASLHPDSDRRVNPIAGYLRSIHARLPRGVRTALEAHGRSLLSAVGMALIAYAVVAYDRQIPYPGVAALAPVSGAVLLIAAGPAALGNRYLLSNRLAVFIGLISYPIYLWHWPLLSYLTIVDNATPELPVRALAAALSIVLAWLTYRFVELQVRSAATTRRRIVVAGLVCAMVLIGVFGLRAKYLYGTYDPQTAKIMEYWSFQGWPGIDGVYIDSTYKVLAFGHNDNNKLLFVGDSHAEQYQNSIARVLRQREVPDSQDALEVLFPSFWTLGFPPKLPPELVADRSVSTVVFSYFWALQYGSGQVDRAVRCCGTGLNGTIGISGGAGSSSEAMDAFDRQFEALITPLRGAGKQVYIVLDNPFGEEVSPRSLLKRSFFHPITLQLPRLATQTAIQRDEPVRSRLIALANKTGAKIIDPIQSLCNPDTCPVLSPDGVPIYKDYDHLSGDAVINHVDYFNGLLSDAAARGERETAQ